MTADSATEVDVGMRDDILYCVWDGEHGERTVMGTGKL